jgi:hypothetical protein
MWLGRRQSFNLLSTLLAELNASIGKHNRPIFSRFFGQNAKQKAVNELVITSGMAMAISSE